MYNQRGADETQIREYLFPQWRAQVPKGQIMLFADNPEARSFGTHEWNQWWESH